MNILVTGGAGFIGSHVCEALLDRGNDVIIIDNINDYYDTEIKKNNIETLLRYRRCIFKQGDVTDLAFLSRIHWESINQVVHLAGYGGIRNSLENPHLYCNTNIIGTQNMAWIAKKYKMRSFVFASSSSVYGNNLSVPFKEDDNTDFVLNPYAASKKAAEAVLYSFNKCFDLNISCLRYFTVYGPRQRPDMAITKFVNAISKDKPIDIFGDGTTYRDYTYISDIVKGTVSALDHCNGFNVYNLGNGNSINLKDLVVKIGKKLNKEPIINYTNLQLGDADRTLSDISKAKVDLHYNPKINIDDGLSLFIDWFNN